MILMQTFQWFELFCIICQTHSSNSQIINLLNLVIFDQFKFDFAQIFLYSLLNYLYISNNLIFT
jgi:hypothetical protein